MVGYKMKTEQANRNKTIINLILCFISVGWFMCSFSIFRMNPSTYVSMQHLSIQGQESGWYDMTFLLKLLHKGVFTFSLSGSVIPTLLFIIHHYVHAFCTSEAKLNKEQPLHTVGFGHIRQPYHYKPTVCCCINFVHTFILIFSHLFTLLGPGHFTR